MKEHFPFKPKPSIIIFFIIYLLILLLYCFELAYFPLIIILKISLIFLFIFILHTRNEFGIYLFLISTIIFGFNGEFQKIYGDIYLSVIMLIIMLVYVGLIKENREIMITRIKKSPLSIPFFISVIIIPLFGVLRGLYFHNKLSFLIKDADGWLFYLFIFCLIGLISNFDSFITVIRVFLGSIFAFSIGHVSLALLLRLHLIPRQFTNKILYEYLHLGGHISLIANSFTKIYTGNGILLVFGISVLGTALLYKNKVISMIVPGLCLTILFLSLLVQYTRGYWLAVLISIPFIVLFLPKISYSKLLLISFAIIIFITVFSSIIIHISPLKVIKRETNKAFVGFEQIHNVLPRIKSLKQSDYDNVSSGAYPSTLKLKQYYTLFNYTMKKPLGGFGFGATLPRKTTFRTGRRRQPFNFEAGYGNLYMKVGFGGFVCFFILFFAIILYFYRLRKKYPFSSKNTLAVVFIVPLFSILITFGSNPYLFSPFGILPIVFSTYILASLNLYSDEYFNTIKLFPLF